MVTGVVDYAVYYLSVQRCEGEESTGDVFPRHWGPPPHASLCDEIVYWYCDRAIAQYPLESPRRVDFGVVRRGVMQYGLVQGSAEMFGNDFARRSAPWG